MLPREIIAALHTSGPELPAKVRRAALKQGKSLVPALCRALDEEHEPRKGTGYGEIHALRLLQEMRATEAIPHVISLLQRAQVGEIRYDAAIFALRSLGEPVVDPLLAAQSTGEDFEDARADVLSQLGVRDPRILDVLMVALERNPVLGAAFLASYGDQTVLPVLSEALDDMDLSDRGLAPTDILEVARAYTDLGGVLSPEQQAKVALDEHMLKERRETWRRAQAAPE
jgi:hypothetical protein